MSEINGKRKRAFVVERNVERAKQTALFTQPCSARSALDHVLLKAQTLRAVHLAVQVSCDILALADRIFFRFRHALNRTQTPVMPLSMKCWRIISRARNRRFLTVPRGNAVTSAISS